MKISKHAQQRIEERNVDVNDLVAVLKDGIKMVNKHDSSKWTMKHSTKELYVVLTGDMSTVVTVFFGRSVTGYKG